MKNFALAALLATVASTATFAGEHKEVVTESKKVETHDATTDPMTAKTTVETTKTTETK